MCLHHRPLSGWYCRSLVSATTYTLVGVMNKFITIVGNVLIWDQVRSVLRPCPHLPLSNHLTPRLIPRCNRTSPHLARDAHRPFISLSLYSRRRHVPPGSSKVNIRFQAYTTNSGTAVGGSPPNDSDTSSLNSRQESGATSLVEAP